MDIKITKATELKRKPTVEEEGSLGFGKRFLHTGSFVCHGDFYTLHLCSSLIFSRAAGRLVCC